MQNFECLVDRIYEAATAPDLWPSLLHDLSRMVNATGGLLGTRRSDQWQGYRVSPDLEKRGSKVSIEDYLRSDAPTRTITTPRLIAANRSGFVSDQELFTAEEYAADPMVTEWMAPNDRYHGAATAIQVPTGDLVLVQFMRRTGLPGFDRGDLDRLDAYRPHLARAGLLAARWRLERLRAAAEALALVGLPAAVLDHDGRVVVANTLMQGISTYVVWRTKDQIAFTDAAATALLRRAVANMNNPVATSVRSFPVRGRPTTEPVVVHLVPISGRFRDLFEGGLEVLVVTPVSAPAPPDTALIQGLFDLTPAEARVACGMVEGMTVDEMAVRYGVVRETVRTQVKAVLAKTGTRRQVEAATKLAVLPRATRPEMASQSFSPLC